MLLQEYLSSSASSTISFAYCPSHEGVEGNERADRLTKHGAAMGPTPPVRILRSNFINDFKRDMSRHWQILAKSQTYKGRNWIPIRQRRRFFKPDLVNKNKWRFFMTISGNDIQTLSRMARAVTNHAPTGEYRERFHPNLPSHCKFCGPTVEHTRAHVLFSCPHKDCIFYINQSSKERQVQLRDEFSQKWKEEAAALKAAANTDSGRAARTAIAANLASKSNQDQRKGRPKPAAKRPNNDDDDFIPVGKKGKAKYSFGGMVDALAPTTRIDNLPDGDNNGDNADKESNASSELRLSYLDDIPLKTRFPGLKAPPPAKPNTKPLTITLPAPGAFRPSRSVTDILRELKETPAKEPLPARFGGGEVAYTASAAQSEAVAFADALANANLPSQPSPPPQPSTTDGDGTQDNKPSAPSLQNPTNLNV
ncbi:hypothetical protein AX14_002502 [Amanita brunnescens Koide BX004]|nr:hypothetical protein AX14_002502 [Amanita brunnescens Koide BX004]